MTIPPKPSNALVLEVLKGLSGDIEALTTRFRRQRLLTIIAYAGLILDLGLSAAFLYLNHQVSERASAVVVNCRAANELGRAQATLWGPLIDASLKNPAQTPESRAQAIEFKKTIDKLAEPRDCDNLG